MNIDYFPYLNAEALMSLKAMQSYVNDTVTLRCMLNFAKRLFDDKIIPKPQYDRICQSIVNKSFNDNGYDLLDNPQKPNETGIVAEVKCYVPAGSNGSYGRNQKKQIDTDIANLDPSSTKARLHAKSVNLAKYVKFLVLLNHRGLYINAIQNVMNMTTRTHQKKYPQLVGYDPQQVLTAKANPQNDIFVIEVDI